MSKQEKPDRLLRWAMAFRDTAGGELTPEQIVRIEWCELLEGMLSQALDDAGLSGLDALSAASMRLREADPTLPPWRRLGMERRAEWRERWDCERFLNEVRKDLERSGIDRMSEEELIRAAEAAKQQYRRERWRGPGGSA